MEETQTLEQTPAVPAGPDPTDARRITVEKLKVLQDYLVVQPLAVSMRHAGGRLFLPENAGVRERAQKGVVIALGPGDWNEPGTALVPMRIDVGDLVFFGKYAGTEEEFDGKRVLVMREAECRLAVPEGKFTVVVHDDAKLNHLVEDWCDVCYGDPESEAKAQLEEDRKQLLAKTEAVCTCGHLASAHAHLTGPCTSCDRCMEFKWGGVDELAPAPTAEQLEVLGGRRGGKSAALEFAKPVDPLDELQLALDNWDANQHFGANGPLARVLVTGVSKQSRPCDGPSCLMMQRKAQTTAGEYWIGARCGHVHTAAPELEP